jgi:hypothetical protein
MYRFDNGYGASVIRHDMSYGHESGLWELAVLRFVKDRWDICYTTDIADDVVGHLDGEEVEALLQKISQLSQ